MQGQGVPTADNTGQKALERSVKQPVLTVGMWKGEDSVL